jgi:hypothetical protein
MGGGCGDLSRWECGVDNLRDTLAWRRCWKVRKSGLVFEVRRVNIPNSCRAIEENERNRRSQGFVERLREIRGRSRPATDDEIRRAREELRK